uniref:phospholipase DDHD1-like n=1 Tax=Myxine glutinosa TaxID=7769 RepID=UPI00358FE3F7
MRTSDAMEVEALELPESDDPTADYHNTGTVANNAKDDEDDDDDDDDEEEEESGVRQEVRAGLPGQAVAPLRPEEVRWFYRDGGSWKPFNGSDSLMIEAAHRRRCQVLGLPLNSSIAGRNQMDELPAGSGSSTEETSPEGERSARGPVPADDLDAECELVCVRGGLHEVNVGRKECYPIYWHELEAMPVMRGQWFMDGTWAPVDEKDGNFIEEEYLAQFQGQVESIDLEGPPKSPMETLSVVHSLQLQGSHIDWNGISEVYLYSDAATSKIARTVGLKLGLSKASSSGTRLHRGYKEDASPLDRPPDISHLVFVVHGIGQKMDHRRIIRNTTTLREAVRRMEEKHHKGEKRRRVEFLPVEWRSKLSLDGDTVDSITLDKVRGLRDMLNSSAMDILYYTSPLYRDEIIKGLQCELNRLYRQFCSRNVHFEESGGCVSLVAHSLGCVIAYDIMTSLNPLEVYERMLHHSASETGAAVDNTDEAGAPWMSYEKRRILEELCKTRKRMEHLEHQLLGASRLMTSRSLTLNFQVENFFCMGSPLAVYLALRGVRPGSNGFHSHIVPSDACRRLLNIFHPTDPVAYRLEPLILRHYQNVQPVQIHWSNAMNRTPYDQLRPVYLAPGPRAAREPPATTWEPESPCSPGGTPMQPRRNYGESLTSLGKAGILGAATLGKGLGEMLFSRFSRTYTPGLPADSQSAADLKDCQIPLSEEITFKEVQSPDSESPLEILVDKDDGMIDANGIVFTEEGILHHMAVPNGDEDTVEEDIEITPESMGMPELDCRIDFELREGLVQSRYWSAVTSHTAYWTSPDIALFIVTFLYGDTEPAEA